MILPRGYGSVHANKVKETILFRTARVRKHVSGIGIQGTLGNTDHQLPFFQLSGLDRRSPNLQ